MISPMLISMILRYCVLTFVLNNLNYSQFVNFLAKVTQPNFVEVQEMVSAGNSLDVNQYNQTVELMHSAKFSHLFL